MLCPPGGKSAVTIVLRNRPGTVSALTVEPASDANPPREVIGALAIIGNAAQLKAEALGLCAAGPAPDSPLLRLTDKQREILLWAAEGKSTSDIAGIMGVKERTVKYHFDEILRKLQVRTRTQAVAMLAKAA
nr:LuxR C-terminal-related transcriptional regulator [Sphingomonas quercus]